MSENILRDVVTRTSGELYLGVVGSVRSGKSSFIRRFMELKVLPFISDQSTYQKVLDELPQSGEGKTITTVEPKFVPSNTMKVMIESDLSVTIRLVDCVGYVIPSSKGYLNDDGSARLVQTPWFSEPIPFGDAAGLGTKKVIESHSNIGILMTSDGSFGEFSRDEYAMIEEPMVEELKSLNKPFVVVVNTKKPYDNTTESLVEELKTKYGVEVIALDVVNMTSQDIDKLLKNVLNEFDISELNIKVPNWISVLDDEIEYKKQFNELVATTSGNYRKMKDIFSIQDNLRSSGLFKDVDILDVDAGSGVVEVEITFDDEIYRQIISELIGQPLDDKGEFLKCLQELQKSKNIYEKVGNLDKVYQVGYETIIPTPGEMKLAKPELLKQNGRYGIKLKAIAPSLQIMRIDVESTFEPIIGSLEQSTALLEHMIDDYENNPEKLWNSEIFGQKLCDVIGAGIKVKVNNVPEKVQEKFRSSLTKVYNNGRCCVITLIY